MLAARLRARPSWRHSSLETAIVEHQRFAAWLRTHIQPCYDTSALTPDETAAQIAGSGADWTVKAPGGARRMLG